MDGLYGAHTFTLPQQARRGRRVDGKGRLQLHGSFIKIKHSSAREISDLSHTFQSCLLTINCQFVFMPLRLEKLKILHDQKNDGHALAHAPGERVL